MAEILEYTLVFMVSTLFVTGSVATYNSFSSWASELQFHEAFSAIVGLAAQALTNGTSRGTMNLPYSTIQCFGGSLTFETKSFSATQNFAAGCNFLVNLGTGTHTMAFAGGSSLLSLSVT
jgi:hypothetical protein